MDDWAALAPFRYGRWDTAAQAMQAAEDDRRNDEAAATFGAEGAFDPDATRAALAEFAAPALLLAGEFDLNSPPVAVTEFAALLPNAQLAIQPGAGHYPWLDDADLFLEVLRNFLE